MQGKPENREELLAEIRALKKAIRQLEYKLDLCKFGNVRQPELLLDSGISSNEMIDKVRNVGIQLEREMYKFSGMHCVKFEEAFTFEVTTGRRVTKNKQYAIQILNDNGQRKLGKWVLPMSIDMDEILLDFPMNDFSNIKPLLKTCKHHVDCYTCRQEQYNELKDYISDILNCNLDANIGYTTMTIKMLLIKENNSEMTYNIVLNLFYKSNEARPYKLIPDLADLTDEEVLAESQVKKFNKYFKPFLTMDLKSAFQKVIDSKKIFTWEKEIRSDNITEAEIKWNNEIAEIMTENRKRRREDNDDDAIHRENELTDIEANDTINCPKENSYHSKEENCELKESICTDTVNESPRKEKNLIKKKKRNSNINKRRKLKK